MSTDTILVINGSYRDDGITDQVVAVAVEELTASGAATEVVRLRDYPIEFCLNCRECTQQPGATPGHCVLNDGMAELVAKIEAAQAYVLAAPTNFGSVTALFKRFMERLIVYAYWPWDKPLPRFRKAALPRKNAMLVSSSAAPAFIGRWMFGSGKQLRMAADTIGARTVGILFTGGISRDQHQRLPASAETKARAMAHKLLAA